MHINIADCDKHMARHASPPSIYQRTYLEPLPVHTHTHTHSRTQTYTHTHSNEVVFDIKKITNHTLLQGLILCQYMFPLLSVCAFRVCVWGDVCGCVCVWGVCVRVGCVRACGVCACVCMVGMNKITRR